MKLYNFTDEQLEGFANEVYSDVIASLRAEGFIDEKDLNELSCNYTISLIKKNSILEGLKAKLFPKDEVELNNRGFRVVLSKVVTKGDK